jgi:hypothetical protein
MQKDLNPGATAFELPELPYGLTRGNWRGRGQARVGSERSLPLHARKVMWNGVKEEEDPPEPLHRIRLKGGKRGVFVQRGSR